MRLIGRRRGISQCQAVPLALKLGAVTIRVVAHEESAVVRNALGDRLSGLDEDRAALCGVAVEQRRFAPFRQHGGELPPEVDCVLEAGVQAVGAVGRVAVRGIPRDEGASALVGIGDVDAQVPEAEVLEGAGHRKARSLLDQGVGVEIRRRRVLGYWRVEEPRLGGVHPPEEPPVSRQRGMQDAVGGARRETRQARVEITRAEDSQDHPLIEVSSAAGDARLLAYHRTGPVAPDYVGSRDATVPGAGVVDRSHMHTAVVYVDMGCRPPEQCHDRTERLDPRAQDGLGQVLRQPFVPLVVEVADLLAPSRGVPIPAREASIRRDASDGESRRQQACGPQLLHATPGVEVLQAAGR